VNRSHSPVICDIQSVSHIYIWHTICLTYLHCYYCLNTVITVFGLLNKGTECMIKKMNVVFLVENLKKSYKMGDTSIWYENMKWWSQINMLWCFDMNMVKCDT
jgi:hypothetical protein